LVTVQETIDAVWGLPKCATLTRARWLHELLALADERMIVPADWFRSSSLQPLLRTAADHHRQSDDYHRRRAALLARYTAALFSLDLPTIRQALATSGLPQTERITGMGTPGDRALTRQERISAAVRRALDCLASVARTSEIVAERLGLPIPKTLARAREVARVAALVLTNPRPLPEWFEIQQRIMIEQLAQDAGARRATVTTDRPPLEQRFTPEFFILATEERKERFADKYASWLRALRPSYHRELRELRQCLREPGELDYADALACLTQARRVAAAEDWLRDQQSALAAGFGWHFAGAQTDWPAVSQALASMRELYVLLGQRGWPPALKGVLLGENGGPVALRPAVHDLDAAINAVESAWGDLATSMSVQNLPFSGAGLDDYLLFPLHDWLRDWLAAVQPLWEADRALRECRKDSSAILPVADLLADACEAAAVCELEQSLMMGAEALRASFGTLFSGLETNWQTVLDALQWVGRMRDHFSGPPPESFVAALLADRQTPLAERARLATLIAATSEQVERLRSWFTAEGLLIDTDAPDDAALDVIAVWATEKLAVIPLLEEWLHYCQALRAAEAVGLVPFVERIRRAGLPPVDWPAIFLKQVYTLWLTWRYEQAPALEHFRWREHEAVVREFANLDRWQYQTAVRRITERLVARRPAVPYAPPRMSEPGILLHEAGKRRRFLPPRKLFAQLPNLLPALKPCLLMSPPTVAQFLGESALEFDLVIFDEASQIMPADAIGAIGRGKQVVVVGDRQQLPPMNFFNAPLDDSDPDEEMPESILDACAAAGLPERRLLWHYRSRREELIAFSNRYYYDGRLITFPSLTDQPPALEFILVEQGRYDRAGSRANRAEARRIADLVIAHVRQRPHQSLGVITFSETQHEAIEYELDRRKRADPTLEPLLRQSDDDSDSFFIRSLEHVQGDERDVIFFSVGYGPDQAGKLSLNFGPLNRQGGERRLNVAVTRARDHIKILASFHPHDLDLTRTSSDGVRLLRRYLEYADQGPRALLGEITSEGGDFESPFEASVAAALTARGLRVVSQVGVSGYRIDLGIKDDQADRYLLGVECDGATYHSAKTARDRDRLRQQVLENLGWHIHRVWSTDWIKDPARETARILAALERARSAPSQPAPVREESPPAPDPPPAPVPSPATEEAPPRAEIAIAAPYRAAQLPPQGDIEQFRSAHSLDLAQLVRAVVAVESPVHQDRVMRAVASSFGITRLGNQVRAQLERAIAAAVRANFATRRGKFLWSPGMTTPQVREDGGRAIGEMPPEELAAGIVALLDAAFSLPRDELITAAARAFGYDRTGNHVGAGFARALDALLAVGTLTEVGGQICLNR
ncbi:MAG: DUF3320 domain-containing protein, partial [Thermomicrobiales bacterium]